MPKRFILDTNVLLHDPNAVEHFGDKEVVIPIYVLEEIDTFKHELSERGRNARMVSRYLDDLREGGSLAEGVPTAKGGLLRVALPPGSIVEGLGHSGKGRTVDTLILQTALDEQTKSPDVTLVFVTKDVNLRIRADAVGLQAVDYEESSTTLQELYTGCTEITVPGETVDEFYSEGAFSHEGLFANQYVLAKDDQNPGHTALARYDLAEKSLVKIRRFNEGVWGIRPRNKEQHFALDLLLNDDVKLVTLTGKAGTGKTLMAIAAGLQKVVEEKKYTKLLVSRPIFPLGKDIGYLPGDVNEKLNPWMQPIYDNMEYLVAGSGSGERKDGYRELIDMGFVAVEPLTYIRGRSIPNQFMIVDEAQNLTRHEVKTIITRVGEGTKIILTGDPYQIDNPYIDSANNGLSTTVDRFKEEAIAGHITLLKGERSALAEIAANLL